MSSMFKKRGPSAFKPKLPTARRSSNTTTVHPQVSPPPDSANAKSRVVSTTKSASGTTAQVSGQVEGSSHGQASADKADDVEFPPTRRLPTPRPTRLSARDSRSLLPDSRSTDEVYRPAEVVFSKGAEQHAGTTEGETPSSAAIALLATANQSFLPAASESSSGKTSDPSYPSNLEQSSYEEAEAARPGKRRKATSQESEARSRMGATTQAPRNDSSVAINVRRTRSVTPEDAESRMINPQDLKMSDLTRDLRIGKKFSRHDELRERQRQRGSQQRLQAKLKKQRPVHEENPGTGNTEESPINPKLDSLRPSTTPAPTQVQPLQMMGPQFRVVDGQIVVDQSSLLMDRHARAAAANASSDMEEIEENDFTRHITSSSFMSDSKLKGATNWTLAETELFYRGLRMFGTDFEIISKMFVGKKRRHVKLKFNREERTNPNRITAALVGEKAVKIDIDEYTAATGATFEPVEAIEAEQRRAEEQFEAERKKVVEEQAELMRKKREKLFADENNENVDGDGGGEGDRQDEAVSEQQQQPTPEIAVNGKRRSGRAKRTTKGATLGG